MYFQALESNIARNLEALSGSIALASQGVPASADPPLYASFSAAIEAVFDLAKTERCVFVIVLFSRSGFTNACVSAADGRTNVRIIGFDEMGW